VWWYLSQGVQNPADACIEPLSRMTSPWPVVYIAALSIMTTQLKSSDRLHTAFLADRDNGRAYNVASVCLSVVCLWRYVSLLWLLTAYRNTEVVLRGIDWYQNEWPWPLHRGRLRSCQPVRHICHWISRKPLVIEDSFQRTTNRKWFIGSERVTWPMTSCGQVVTPIRLKLENSWRCYLATIAITR